MKSIKCKKGITYALWNEIKDNFDEDTLTQISLNPSSKPPRSVIVSDDKRLKFDSYDVGIAEVCAADMISFVNDEIVLTEFKDGGIEKVDIYRKAVESILVIIRILSKDKAFNPFNYNFKFELVYSFGEASSRGAKDFRERSYFKPALDYVTPLKNHLYRDVQVIPSNRYIVR